MSIKGEIEKGNGSIALTGLYIDDKYCKHEPLWAKQGKKHTCTVILLLKTPHLQAVADYETIQNELMTVRKFSLIESFRGESRKRCHG